MRDMRSVNKASTSNRRALSVFSFLSYYFCIPVHFVTSNYFSSFSCLLWVLGTLVLLLLHPDTLLCDGNGGLVCVADKGKMSWSRGCRLCKRAGGNWWCSWRDWWSCSRWHTHSLVYCHTLEGKVSLFLTSLSVLAVTSFTFSLLLLPP